MLFLETWRSLPTRNKLAAGGAAIIIAFMMAALFRVATTPPMALLYSGLDPAASGEILEALEALDVPSEVRGDAIYVPQPKRDATRMALARNGLPRQSTAGYEILDELSGFSTSADMFDAAYWRAKEGELARTILAERGVTFARVHIAAPRRASFTREKASPSAAVTVGMTHGRLDLQRAQSVRLLVALAVPGLSPEQVAVLDAAGGVVLAPGDGGGASLSGNNQSDRERALEDDLVRLLEARVGPGNARVKVTLSFSDEQTVRHERLVDPDRRALINTDTSEVSEQGVGGSGVVTVASNLPEGDAAPAIAPGQSKRSESQSSSRFEISEIKTETVMMPGALKKVHVAVLINDAQSSGGAEPSANRSESEISALRKLVSAAVGFNEERGDVVTIESLPFDQPSASGAEAKKNDIADFLGANLMSMLQLVIPAAVSLILALFVLRPLLAAPSRQSALELAPPAAPTVPSVAAPATPQSALANIPAPADDLQRAVIDHGPAATDVLKSWLEHSEPAR